MPYCSKCDAKVAEGVAFCPSCGAPTGLAAPAADWRRRPREARRPFPLLVIVLIVLLVGAAIIVVITFVPLRRVDVSESRSVSHQTGVDTLFLDFTADVAHITIAFGDLDDALVRLHLSILGTVGAFATTSRSTLQPRRAASPSPSTYREPSAPPSRPSSPRGA